MVIFQFAWTIIEIDVIQKNEYDLIKTVIYIFFEMLIIHKIRMFVLYIWGIKST